MALGHGLDEGLDLDLGQKPWNLGAFGRQWHLRCRVVHQPSVIAGGLETVT